MSRPIGSSKVPQETILKLFSYNKVVTREELFAALGLSLSPEDFGRNYWKVAQVISRLRTKIHPDKILPVRNQGYILVQHFTQG